MELLKTLSTLKVRSSLKTRADNIVFRLHYKLTVWIYLVGAAITALSLAEKKIDCYVEFYKVLDPSERKKENLQKVVDSYCYITGTYTVDKLHYGQVGVDMPHQGVGPHDRDVDTVTYHTWYQWVPFVLLGQACLFYIPHLIWKNVENGFFVQIIYNLPIKLFLNFGGGDNKEKISIYCKNYNSRVSYFKTLSNYLMKHSKDHAGWAVKFLLCEMLNIVIVVLTVFVTNDLLQGEFFSYGFKMFQMSMINPENRTDQLAQVFPTMGKCDFKVYGPSGTIEKIDVLCILPCNILNEKIFMFLWFWLLFVGVVDVAWMLFRAVSVIKFIRNKIFMEQFYREPRIFAGDNSELQVTLATKKQIRQVIKSTDLNKFLLLSQLSESMEPTLFSEFLAHYSDAYLEAERNKKLVTDKKSVTQNSDGNGQGYENRSQSNNPGEKSQLYPSIAGI